MDWHVFIVFGAIFCGSCIHDVQSFSQIKIRGRRSPQNNGGAFFQANGALNLGGLNIQQVRKRLHDLVDTVTNPLNVNVMGQVTPEGTNYPQYDYDYQEYGYPPPGPPFGPPNHGRGPPHRHHHRGPPPRDYHGGGPPPRFPPPRGPPPGGPPPRGPPPRGPPPRGPPYDVFQPPVGEDDLTLPVTWPSDQPNHPGNSNVNIDLSSSTPASSNSNERSQSGEDGNVAGYIENNFPVILLNENEIR